MAPTRRSIPAAPRRRGPRPDLVAGPWPIRTTRGRPSLPRTVISCRHKSTSDRVPDQAHAGDPLIQAAYRLPVSRKSRATVAVSIAYQAPHLAAYLARYRKYYHLSACTTASGCLRIVNQRGKASPLHQRRGAVRPHEQRLRQNTTAVKTDEQVRSHHASKAR